MRSLLFSSLISGGVILLSTYASAVPIVIGSITIDTDNSVTSALASTDGTISFNTFNAPIQGAGNPAIDDDHHIGALAGGAGGSAVDLTGGTNGANGRTTLELTWDSGFAAENVVGDDLFVVESGTFNGSNSFPEAFAVAVREEGGSFTNYRYEFIETGDASTLKLVTAFDFSDFGLASGARVDAVRVISLKNASSASEDRAIDSSGAGEIVLDAGSGSNFSITQGPLGGNGDIAYPDSAMDADIVYVAGAQVAQIVSSADNWSFYQ